MTEMFQQRRSFRREKDRGNVPLRKGVDSSKLASDPVSFTGYSKEEDSLPFELRQSKTTEASIKKLLAEEMSKEMESRRRPPSVIAKLMGLDALPTQSPLRKQQKKFYENYQQRTASASIGSVEKGSTYEGRSSRMSCKEQEEFKDVFEVLEPSKVEKHSSLSSQKGMWNLKTSEAKMDLVRQKFLDVKHLSTDEKLQHSKEFHDALDVLDSNKDLLLKFLQEPDSLFTKHLHDLQGAPPPPPPSQPGHITVLKSSNANGNVPSKSERKIVLDDVDISVQKPEVGVGRAHNRHGVHSSGKVPNSQFGNKDEPSLVPTRIVVLKPNLRKAQNSTIGSAGSLGGSHLGHQKHTVSRSCENLDLFSEVRDRRSSSIELEGLKNRNRGSREIAREITRQMRHSVNSRRLSSSTLRGYAGDESSGSASGTDSANESEVMTPASRHFHDWRNRCSPSSSHSTESSVSREAKKRLSERWKMTHRPQDVPRLGRGSTLGEMLAMPDRETRATTLDSEGVKDGFTETVTSGAVTRWDTPLGISSRDGWKDECARSLARSRSLPASSTALASPKMSIRRQAHGSDRFSMPKELACWDPYKSKKLDLEQTEGFVSRSSSNRSKGKRSHSLPSVAKEKKHSTQEFHLKSDKLSINLEEEHLPEEKAWNIELANDNVVETIHVTDEIAIAKPEDEMTSYESPQEQQSEEKSCITSIDDRDTSSYNPEHSNREMKSMNPSDETSFLSHCTVTEVESSASCKEAGQPSPISVLETPFVEETMAGSDSFEKVSADLHGLRMQLHLLKLESSDAHSDEFEMMVSSDEDFEERYSGHQKDNEEVNRDYSYVIDVLVDAGIHNEDMDVLLTTWYASECLVHVDVFEKLEKKYTEQTAWTKSERRFLFDCINLKLLEILQPHMDPHPWVQPGRKIARKWTGPVTEELWKLLARWGEEETVDPLDKVLGKDVKWMELGDDIDAVGREMEKLLLEELVDEVVRML